MSENNATIGDDVDVVYRFDWGDRSRTTDEIGDLEEAGFDITIDDIVGVARADDECTVTLERFQ